MITVGMNYHVIDGKQQDFEEKFAAVIESLRAAARASRFDIVARRERWGFIPDHERVVGRAGFHRLYPQRRFPKRHELG